MKELKYSIITEIKITDKSKVYLASMKDLNFPVVVKEIQHGNIQVFRALMNMDNEHLPKIYYVEPNGNGLTVVEEYIEGEVMSDYIAKGNLTEDMCIDFAKQLCDVLKVLHSHTPALIHRDIKPSNMIINSKGRLILIDFDSTRIYKDESESDTRLLGTEHYAPPEQYGFSQTDCRSDIYSVGVVFEKFTPFINKCSQKQWKRIVERCTLFSPDSRFQNADEIAIRLGYLNNKRRIFIPIFVVIILVISAVTTSIVFLNKKSKTMEAFAKGDTITETDKDITIPTEQGASEMTEPNTTVAVDNIDHTVDYKVISPEWRDLATDSQALVDYKTDIRRNRSVVIYLFKDRMREKDFFLQEKDLDRPGISCVGVCLYNIDGVVVEQINEEYYKVEDGTVIISYEYMNSIKNGYYRIGVLKRDSEGYEFQVSTDLYVSDSDQLQEPEDWIQNSSFETCGDTIDKFHMVVRNDSYNRIVALYDVDGKMIDQSLYRIVQDQRAIEISGELINDLAEGETRVFYIVGSDGRKQLFAVRY